MAAYNWEIIYIYAIYQIDFLLVMDLSLSIVREKIAYIIEMIGIPILP